MNYFNKTAIAAFFLGVIFISSTAFASATKTNGTLEIFLDFVSPGVSESVDQSAKIFVDSGTVTIFGVPDDVTGTLFDGKTFSDINEIKVDSGKGNDNVNFEIVTDQEKLDIEVNSTMGQAETKIKMLVLSGGDFSSTIDLDFGNLEDKLELELDSQSNTNLIVNATTVSGGEKSIAVKAMYRSNVMKVSNMFDLDLGGSEDETSIEIKSEANSLANIFSIDSDAGEDVTKIVIEHLGGGLLDNDFGMNHGSGEDGTDVIIKSSTALVGLSGMINAGASDNKVNIEVDAPDVVVSSLNVMAESGRDELNATFKGDVVVVPGSLTLSAGPNDDKLKLQVEGGLTGAAQVDGGDGFDECEAFPGVTFISCEIAKE